LGQIKVEKVIEGEDKARERERASETAVVMLVVVSVEKRADQEIESE
jgi:hypothetical protein